MFKITLFIISLSMGDQIFRVGATLDPTPLHHCLIAFLMTILIGPRFAIAFYLGIEWRDGWISPEGFDLLDIFMVFPGVFWGLRIKRWLNNSILPAIVSRAIRA